jgi:hypothetical protein
LPRRHKDFRSGLFTYKFPALAQRTSHI